MIFLAAGIAVFLIEVPSSPGTNLLGSGLTGSGSAPPSRTRAVSSPASHYPPPTSSACSQSSNSCERWRRSWSHRSSPTWRRRPAATSIPHRDRAVDRARTRRRRRRHRRRHLRAQRRTPANARPRPLPGPAQPQRGTRHRCWQSSSSMRREPQQPVASPTLGLCRPGSGRGRRLRACVAERVDDDADGGAADGESEPDPQRDPVRYRGCRGRRAKWRRSVRP